MLFFVLILLQGETKVLKLKNLRPKDFADYTCQVSVRNVCNIEDKSVTFRLTNATGSFFSLLCTYKDKHILEIHSHIQAVTDSYLTLFY